MNAIVMKAFADEMRDHFARGIEPGRRIGIDIPAPIVNVDPVAPVVNVLVDMAQVVNAYERLAEEVKGQNEILSRLIDKLTEVCSRPVVVQNSFSPLFNPSFNPSFNPKVNVETPQAEVHVSLPEPAQGTRKQLVITHSDGTKSTVKES